MLSVSCPGNGIVMERGGGNDDDVEHDVEHVKKWNFFNEILEPVSCILPTYASTNIILTDISTLL